MSDQYKTVQGYRVKKAKSDLEKRLTDEEVDRLLSSFTYENHRNYWKRNKAIALLFLNTGLRVGEVAGLKAFDVLKFSGEIKKILDVRPEIAKRKKARQVPLNTTSREAIKTLLEGRDVQYDDHLLVTSTGNPLSKRAIQHIVTNACLRAGIDRLVGCHALRHTCLSRLYEKTKNIKVVQTIAGHANSKLTIDFYTHATMDGLTSAMEELEDQEDGDLKVSNAENPGPDSSFSEPPGPGE